ncbi:MAG: hypothetical protein NXI13_02495 [Proteobacteria bacterium]|nr:hypothetical protein [Pseudomonadota bacterium]
MDWFRHQLWLQADLGQGISREVALKQIGKLPSSKVPLEPPPCLGHLVEWIAVLIPLETRSPARIAADIQARFGLPPRPSELTVLMDMIDLWRDHQMEENKT